MFIVDIPPIKHFVESINILFRIRINILLKRQMFCSMFNKFSIQQSVLLHRQILCSIFNKTFYRNDKNILLSCGQIQHSAIAHCIGNVCYWYSSNKTFCWNDKYVAQYSSNLILNNSAWCFRPNYLLKPQKHYKKLI